MSGRSGLWLCGFVMLGLIAGCGSSPSGPIDKRLIGKWETRRGLSNTLTIDFKNDGTAQVTNTEEGKSKSYTAKWYVAEKGKEKIKINMQAGGTSKYEMRGIKFLEGDFLEMNQGGKILGRFQKLGA